MPGGKGKSGGKTSGGKASADGPKKQQSHSARAGLQVSSLLVMLRHVCRVLSRSPSPVQQPAVPSQPATIAPGLHNTTTRPKLAFTKSTVLATVAHLLGSLGSLDKDARRVLPRAFNFSDGLKDASHDHDPPRRTTRSSDRHAILHQPLHMQKANMISPSSPAAVSSVSSSPTPRARCASVPRLPSTPPPFSST